jgi:hypothetical protein
MLNASGSEAHDQPTLARLTTHQPTQADALQRGRHLPSPRRCHPAPAVLAEHNDEWAELRRYMGRKSSPHAAKAEKETETNETDVTIKDY